MTLVWCLVITLWTTTLANSQELPPEVGILKQINRVNDDGSYTFGYEATDGSFKIETRDVLGNIKGMFGFIDENGELKRVSYTANNGTGFQASGNIGNSPSDKVIPTSGYTTVRPASTDSSSRRPVLILRTPPDDNTRAPVIQHIPRKTLVKGSTTAQSTTTPVYGEYINGRRPQPITDLFLNPNNEVTTTSEPQVTETPDDITTTNHPIRKILITKRPVDEKVTKSKGGNALRRQLTRDPESRSDTADVYSGDTTPRYLPPGRSQFVPSLPPQLVTAYRNQLLAQNGLRESTTQPPYRPDFNFPPPGYLPFDQNQYPPTPPPIPNRNRIPIPLPNLPQPYPIPGTISPRNRPSVVDEQEYPVQDNRKYIPSTTRPINNSVRPVYQQDDGVSPPYPASYRSLRDELMEYLLQYLQYRSNRINPYLPPNYQNQFPNPNVNYPYPNQPYNFNPYINPNFVNPYINPNINPNVPFQNPYINPYTPQPLGYPNVNYPQNIPNVPYVTPNIQYSGQQYTQSSQYVPRGYEPDPRLPPVESQRSRPPQASTDAVSYQLPPAQLLRMLLARGTTKEYDTQPTQTTTLESYTTTPQPTTKQPVRNVQIVAAASTTSSVTVQPPKDEMEMQA
uniref:Cuticle protein 6 n=1 Tax=Clastoptera arizonana TaxID=38151 RepID=A0A1B6C490_9HEMI